MNILIILAHPNPESFNHAIAHVCRNKLQANGHTLVLHDLHAEGFNPSNTIAFREDTLFKDLLETIWRNCIFDFCGIKTFHRSSYRIVVTSDLQQRKAWIKEAEAVMDRYFG